MKLSVIVGSFELKHQILRTIMSIRQAIKNQTELEVEIIIADNSTVNVLAESKSNVLSDVRILSYGTEKIPIHIAMNRATNCASGDFLCVMIDGARIWSPQILKKCIPLLSQSALIHVPNYQLGCSHQMYSKENGHTVELETKILMNAGWPSLRTEELIRQSWCEDHAGLGPRVFESNCLFVSRELWNSVQGFDSSFKRVDGGFASADLLERLVAKGGELQILSTEGTFHQLHHGSTTTTASQTRQAVREMTLEYKLIRGQPPKRVSIKKELPVEIEYAD